MPTTVYVIDSRYTHACPDCGAVFVMVDQQSAGFAAMAGHALKFHSDSPRYNEEVLAEAQAIVDHDRSCGCGNHYTDEEFEDLITNGVMVFSATSFSIDLLSNYSDETVNELVHTFAKEKGVPILEIVGGKTPPDHDGEFVFHLAEPPMSDEERWLREAAREAGVSIIKVGGGEEAMELLGALLGDDEDDS